MEDKSRTPSHWEQLSEVEVADCKVFKVLRRKMRNPSNGKEGDFSVIKAFNWVVAIAETVDHNYVIVNQFRFGSKALSWEFPAGCIDENEDPVIAAERELREESGYLPQAPGRIIGKARPNPALQDKRQRQRDNRVGRARATGMQGAALEGHPLNDQERRNVSRHDSRCPVLPITAQGLPQRRRPGIARQVRNASRIAGTFK